jgi:flagellar biosynthesis/type III secretory pathway ATPase
VGFSEQRVLLMPFGDLQGIEIGSEVIATGRSADVAVGDELLGRVIDGFGLPLDGAPLELPSPLKWCEGYNYRPGFWICENTGT